MSGEKKQFIYILRLTPALLNDSNWTKREEDIVDRHFSRLQKLLDEGKLILAGKTAGIDERPLALSFWRLIHMKRRWS